jgi:acetyltransferase-like isoleucine patch superfamily enzyme
MVTVVGATNGVTNRVKLGEACDVTNDCTLLPGATVGQGAVLGVFTYGRPEQSFADYSITQGEFTLRSGGCGADVEAGVASGKLESAATRLIPTWQYVLYNVLYILGSQAVFSTTGAFMALPVPLLAFSVLYNWGLLASALCLPLYMAVGFGVLLGYLTLLKRVVMADTGGQYTIFTSFSAAKWQMLCLNAHVYGDFNELKGSVFYNWYLRCMGTRVGRDVCCLGGVVAEYEQVSIGDGAVIGEGSFLLTHTVENRQVKIRPITIAPRVTVGALCAVLPDAAMEEGSALADMSLVMKGETVPAGGAWAGLPACAAPKFTL